MAPHKFDSGNGLAKVFETAAIAYHGTTSDSDATVGNTTGPR